ncbi:unnamed protein product [Lathyrus oleraceus]|uniref:Cytochrome P450 n=1 Tax=Pisum sativum TaxID=3888 RepID=A0A9D4Y2I0_PEA|nr:cytochrome P450 714A2-like [Pisum sativum]KAI5430639.1 hypothetical protein KIW84_035014 [Pisum sativum]
MILEGAKSCEGSDELLPSSTARERFNLDNCKTIFFAGHESTAITASWCLTLLAIHHDWPDRVSEEVLEVCGNGNPDANKLRSMKTLTMVIQETLRLYFTAMFIGRRAYQDIDFTCEISLNFTCSHL